jgi:hypothetical protein
MDTVEEMVTKGVKALATRAKGSMWRREEGDA